MTLEDDNRDEYGGFKFRRANTGAVSFLDLLIATIREHEKKLSEQLEKLEKIAETLDKVAESPLFSKYAYKVDRTL